MTNERAITIDHFNEKTFSDLDVVSKSSSNGHSASDTAEGMPPYCFTYESVN